MSERESAGRELTKGAGRVIGHLAAIVVGVVLMILGVALGVGLVTLPAAVPIGLAGLVVCGWGLFGWSPEKGFPATPPS
jgi:hypothetical protein